MPNDYEFTDPPQHDFTDEELWGDDDEELELPTGPYSPPEFFRWVFDGGERFAAGHSSEGYHHDLLARFGAERDSKPFARGTFILRGRTVELSFYEPGDPVVDRHALEARLGSFLHGRQHTPPGRYSRHLRSFVWADGQLELERDGERVAHAELERRLYDRLPQSAQALGPAVHGEVWQRGGRRHAAHTPASDLEALRAALGSALPGPTIAFEQIDAEGR